MSASDQKESARHIMNKGINLPTQERELPKGSTSHMECIVTTSLDVAFRRRENTGKIDKVASRTNGIVSETGLGLSQSWNNTFSLAFDLDVREAG